MGLCFSCLKKNDLQAPILKNNMYCARCGKVFIYTDYQKHIVNCTDSVDER